MGIVDSTSTRQEVRDAIADNASYREDGSVAKAKAFITAATNWLFQSTKRSAMAGGEEIELDLAVLREMINDAKTFISQGAADDDGVNLVTQADLRDFRS